MPLASALATSLPTSRATTLVSALAAILLAWPAPASAQTLAITGATVIDGTGRAAMPDATVLIVDGRIAALGAARTVTIPVGATRVDGRGKFVIPGLMDANLHLYLNGDLESLITLEDRYHEVVLEGAQIALRSGLTTVFDTWGPRAALVKARDMIAAGQAPGSRIFLAGNIIGFGGPLSPDFRGASAAHVSKAFAARTNATWEQGTGRELLWMPPDTLRLAIQRYTALDVDFLKYGGSGHVDMNFLSFSERQQRAIVEEGHRAGKTVQAHVTSPESIDMAIEAGADILTHGDISGPRYPIPPETIQKLLARGTAVSVLAISKRQLEALQTHAPKGVLTPYMTIAATNIRNMVRAGVPLLVSTDAGVQDPVLLSESSTLAVDTVDARVKLGEGHFNAMVGLEEAGMAPMEILKSATSHVARAYKVDRDLGTLEVGKVGDVVILDTNPLEGARNYRRIHSVIKDGKLVDIARLPVSPVISNKKTRP
ncbi:MAG: amidohydrolase family protein [Gemmatimonadaceae bacterium]|nr:amidohydrolase family protein [Gemmatimonadaceae bacterium]